MNTKNKKIIALGLSTVLLTTGLTLFSATYLNNEISYVDEDNSPSKSNPDIASDKFDNSFHDKVYYVHRNDNRTILSQQERVEGYECLGIYSSKSSAEVICYVVENDNDTISYRTVSYDDLEGKIDEYDNIYVIDEKSPSSLDAFVPDCSINMQGYSKTLK